MKAQYVLCRENKTPIQGKWQERKPSREDVAKHLENSNHLVGLVPGSVGCLVIDVDDPGPEKSALRKIDSMLENHLVVLSRKGYHIWVPIGDDDFRETIGNAQWKAHGGHGDIRCDKGYVILWDRKAVVDWRLGNPAPMEIGDVLQAIGLMTVEGNRNNRLNAEVFKAMRMGDPDALERAVEEATLAGLDEAEVQATLKSAVKAAAREGKAIDRTANGLEIMLRELGVQLRYNTRAMTNQIKYQDLPWVNVSDRIINHLIDLMRSTFVYATANGFKPFWWPSELWRVAYNAVLYRHETDPFKEYLEELPLWDGTERIETILMDMFGVEDTPLNRWASGYIFRGVVQRTYQPGAKLDVMPVFIGQQGIGKSSFLRNLFPMENPEWFSDALNLSADVKVRAEMLQGRVVVEVGEMIGATRAELESLKTFLSRTDDGNIRFAYRQNPETMLRRCIIVGTTNDEQCLPNDPTGLRRFLPITFNHGCCVEVHMDVHREQLWAEAMEWYANSDGNAAIPYHLTEQAKIVTEKARRADEILEDKLEQIADKLDNGELFGEKRNEGLSLNEIAMSTGLTSVGSMLDRGSAMRLSAALKQRGWYKRKEEVKGKPINKWYPDRAI